MRTVLIVADRTEEYYYGPFIKACEKKDLRICILDLTRFPTEADFSIYLSDAEGITGHIGVLEYGTDGYKNVQLPVTDTDIAWYLREGGNRPARRSNSSPSLEQRFSENELRVALRSFLTVLDCKWVNRKETVELIASNKLYQQLIARRCGLSTPRTLVSNDPERVVSFSDPNCGLLLKSLGYIRLDDDEKCALYSERFSHDELMGSDAAIHACPIFAQEYVEKRYEHRVMVIGSRVLSCRIDSQASELTKVDWRHYDFDNVEHVQVELPLDIQQNLLHFMAEIDLRYGAIDLIEMPDGKFVFLEVNPSGQWGWIADIAGLPITEAAADMLESL